MEKRVSIIIVSWNVCDDVLQCIDSIDKNPPLLPYEIILVDNCSLDDTVQRVRQEFPEAIVIENGENLGFAAANNIGVIRATGEYIVFLNPDTVVLPEAFDKLIAFMDFHPDVGLCGPQILNSDMTIQRSVRRFPNMGGIFYRFTCLKYLGLFRQNARDWKMQDFDHAWQSEVEQLMGAALIAKTSIVKELQGFDERFFMYYEEVDLCYRIKKTGKQIVFFPEAKIIHHGGKSAKQIPAKVKFMMLRSLVLYIKKHPEILGKRMLLYFFKIGVLGKQAFDMILYLMTAFVMVVRPGKIRRNLQRSKSCFVFLVKYSITFLTT